MPPDVPATVKAGVVVGVATEIRPPVKPTLVTVPEPPLHEDPVPVRMLVEDQVAHPVNGGMPTTPPPCCAYALADIARAAIRDAANLNIRIELTQVVKPQKYVLAVVAQ